MSQEFTALDQRCINALRALAIDAVEAANSGHPGLPLGAAPMAYVLWQRHLRHHPGDPQWADRDRFVLSPGHGSMLLYGLLHLNGYPLSLEDLRQFRQWGSATPGHPEFGHTAGVEATTGPLGQGSANAVGMALAERWMAARYNTPGQALVDHTTYALVSDGDLMEGISAEAGSLAGHLKLGKLIYLYDDNGICLDGPTTQCFSTEDVAARYEAYGWHVQRVADGDHDLQGIDAAIRAARSERGRPSLILVKTTIGFGSPAKAGTSASHGSPLGAEEAERTKATLDWEGGPFEVPDEVYAHFRAASERGKQAQAQWTARCRAHAAEAPERHAEWELAQRGELPAGWDAGLPRWKPGEKLATRAANGKALNALAERIPWVMGGDADLGGSTKTMLAGTGIQGPEASEDRNIKFGVREHAMAAIANGMAYHGGVRAFTATFFVFSDYMRPSIRLAAMNGLPVAYVFTHDSVGVGEDGPTHQPVEHLMALRTIPGLDVVRPADANETSEAWRAALARSDGPTLLVFSRQDLPVLPGGHTPPVARGAYVVRDPQGLAGLGAREPEALLIATGSEVALALDTQERLAAEGVAVRVVSMPNWSAFERQDAEYRETVLPAALRARVSVEAGVTLGWHRWVGSHGACVGIDRYGASAPGDEVMSRLGLNVDNVAATVQRVLAQLASSSATVRS